jgi:hypothetical protein
MTMTMTNKQDTKSVLKCFSENICTPFICLQKIGVPYRVSVPRVESLGGHFATLCLDFYFYEVKKNIIMYVSKRKGKYLYTSH